ncbi:anti-sigma factor [Angustibacter peucedani]
MTHDPHTMTGAYALDALDDDERRAFEQHLAGCPECTAEVEGLRATGAVLGLAATTGVPAAFASSVMAEVRTTRQLPPLADSSDDEGRVLPLLRRARTTSRALLAVAAALLVVAGSLGGLAVREQHQAAQARQVAAQMSSVIGASDARQVDGGGVARVIVSPSQGKAVFVGQQLPPVDADHVLQLWVLDGGTRSVGVIEGSTALLATGVRPGAKLGVTVEPAGGSRQPTTAPVMTMDLSA